MNIIMPIVFALAGLLVGWGYFVLLRFSLTKLGGESPRILPFVALYLLRLILFAGGIVAAALVGTWSLIAYAVAFVVARSVTVCKSRCGLPNLSGSSEGKKDDR